MVDGGEDVVDVHCFWGWNLVLDAVQIGVWREMEILGGAGPVAWGIKDLDLGLDLRA